MRPSSLAEYDVLYARSIADPDTFWAEQRSRLAWFAEPQATRRGGFDDVDFEWFPGGRLNVAWNCLDRHLPSKAGKVAIRWAKDEPGQYEDLTFRALHAGVCQMANLLAELGVRQGDRVCIYLPMIPMAAISMLACARLGAVHSVVFAGFSAEALRARIEDADCAVVITADEGLRGGKHIPLKRTVDDAVASAPGVRHVLVCRRTGAEVPMRPGRDRWLDDELARHRPVAPVAWMDSEAPLFVLYTSGSTGRPKGVLHTTAGYLLYAAYTHELVFDPRPDSVHFCAADVGWVTGHSYVVYGPLCNGITTVMFESVPTWPDAGRYWQVVDHLGVDIFYTAPTALRAIAREGDAWVRAHSRASLRVLGSVGEPINPEVWRWYHEVVGEGRCPVVDTWWQTETGGILIAPLAGLTPTKPGSATRPLPGIQPVVIDPAGVELVGNGVAGNLCLRGSWPGQARTLLGDHARFIDTYFRPHPGLYLTGDGCRRDLDGDYWITGRVDDVLNVSGHRIGTAEVESALVAHPAVAEAAVVGYPHEIKGTGIFAFVLLNDGWTEGEELTWALRDAVRSGIGALAIPDRIVVAPGLPKTRSGKIMRRILRKLAEGDVSDLGDVTTLADPGVVSVLRALLSL